MTKKVIYVLHQYGAPSHFYGLDEYAELNNYSIVYRELNQVNAIKRLFRCFDMKFFINIFFLLTVMFRKKIKVVVAVAPYNRFIPIITKILKRHDVYFFTSYSCWDQSVGHHPINGNNKLLASWRYFTNEFVKHNFVVTNRTKQELISNNFAKDDKISVVYHSYKTKIIADDISDKTLSFVQVGRLVPEKGITQIIDVFKKYPECNITFVGNGKLKDKVTEAERTHTNIKYAGFVNNFDDLEAIYKSNSFVLLNSQHLPNSTWEEYFGLVIIEGMACGCVPIASDHTGPKEIIENNKSGIVYRADNLEMVIQAVIGMTDIEYKQMRYNSISRSKEFHSSNIAYRWRAIDID